MRRTPILAPLLLAGTVIVGCASDDGAPTAGGGGATTSTVGVLPDTLPAGAEAVGEADAVRAVTTWIASLADGDLDAAWALVDPSSQDAFGGREQFDRSGSALAEGYGAWASVPDLTTAWISLGDDAGVGVVVLQGTLRQEGTTTPAAARAVPVRMGTDGVVVDPFHQVLDPARISVEPAAGTTLERGEAVRVSAPGAERLELFVGDRRVASTSAVGPATADLEGRVPEGAGGAIAVTLVAQPGDGQVQALAHGYRVTG